VFSPHRPTCRRLIGPELGLLDQGVGETVARGVGDRKVDARVDPAVPSAGWARRDVGDARRGDGWASSRPMLQLDRLLSSGRAAVGDSGTDLRVAATVSPPATGLVASSRGPPNARATLRDVLERAGVKGLCLKRPKRQLRRLGRQRGAQLYRWHLAGDLRSQRGKRHSARVILERLIVRLAATPASCGKLRDRGLWIERSGRFPSGRG